MALSAKKNHEKVTSYFLKNNSSGSTDKSKSTAVQ